MVSEPSTLASFPCPLAQSSLHVAFKDVGSRPATNIVLVELVPSRAETLHDPLHGLAARARSATKPEAVQDTISN